MDVRRVVLERRKQTLDDPDGVAGEGDRGAGGVPGAADGTAVAAGAVFHDRVVSEEEGLMRWVTRTLSGIGMVRTIGEGRSDAAG